MTAQPPSTDQPGAIWSTPPPPPWPPRSDAPPWNPGHYAPPPRSSSIREMSSEIVIRSVAILGGFLVMAAAVAAAAARWGDLSVTVRLVLLGLLLVCVTGAAELIGGYLPMVGRVLDHLSAYLVFPVVATTSALARFSWRENLLAGGTAAALAVGLQGWRKNSRLLTGSTAVGATIAAAGLAAMTGAPVAAYIGVLAAAALPLGWQKRATLLAALSTAVPLLAVFPPLGIGRGVLTEMGASGSGLSVGMVVGGLFSGSVLAYLARTKRSVAYAGGTLSVFCLVIGGAIDLVNSTRPLFLVPGLGLIGMQMIASWKGSSDPQAKNPAWRAWLDAVELVPIITISPVFLVSDRFAVAGAALMSVGYWLAMRRARSFPVWGAALGFVVFCAMATAQFIGLVVGPEWQWIGLGVVGVVLAVGGSAKKSAVWNLCGLTMTAVGALGFLFDSRVALDWRVVGLVIVLATIERSVHRLPLGRFVSWIPSYLMSVSAAAAYLMVRLADASSTRYAVTLAIAFALVAIGAVAKHHMALIIGALLLAVTMVSAFADELADLPVWVWAMAGGLGLLVLAGTLEHLRSKRKNHNLSAQTTDPIADESRYNDGALVDPFDDGILA